MTGACAAPSPRHFYWRSWSAWGRRAAAECPPGALGVSRTIVVDPSEHVRSAPCNIGESLPLKDREVVLTFDDGPLPPYTSRVLDTLASECVKATFFMVGRMVRGYPCDRAARLQRRPHGRQSQPEPPLHLPQDVGRPGRAGNRGRFRLAASPRSAIRKRSRRSFASPACCARIRSSSTLRRTTT